MTKDEALKLAQEALHGFIPYLPLNDGAQCGRYDKAITAIKEALPQPEQETPKGWKSEIWKSVKQQEPVTWGVDWGKAGDIPCVSIIKRVPNGSIDVMAVEYAPYSYTTPPQRTWVGLTEKDILEAAVKSQEGISPRNDTLRFAVAIEAKLKEKNNG